VPTRGKKIPEFQKVFSGVNRSSFGTKLEFYAEKLLQNLSPVFHLMVTSVFKARADFFTRVLFLLSHSSHFLSITPTTTRIQPCIWKKKRGAVHYFLPKLFHFLPHEEGNRLH